MSSERYIVTHVSVGAAGLTQRPAVYDTQTRQIVHTYRQKQEHLAHAMAEKLNREDRPTEVQAEAKSYEQLCAESDASAAADFDRDFPPSIGDRVSYEDMANPRREGTIVQTMNTPFGVQYLVEWDDRVTESLVAQVWSDLRQHGWKRG